MNQTTVQILNSISIIFLAIMCFANSWGNVVNARNIVKLGQSNLNVLKLIEMLSKIRQ